MGGKKLTLLSLDFRKV